MPTFHFAKFWRKPSLLRRAGAWSTKDYCNIWVVRDICSSTAGCGTSGYASTFHGTPEDGIVIEAEWLLDPAKTAVLIHEVGHYLNLFHTFEEGGLNADCLRNGDRVCDTPPDKSAAILACETAENSYTTDA